MVDSSFSKKNIHLSKQSAEKDQLKDKTVEELRKMASKKKIEGRSKMNKAELVRALKKKTSTKKTMKKRKMKGGALTDEQIEAIIANPTRYKFQNVRTQIISASSENVSNVSESGCPRLLKFRVKFDDDIDLVSSDYEYVFCTLDLGIYRVGPYGSILYVRPNVFRRFALPLREERISHLLANPSEYVFQPRALDDQDIGQIFRVEEVRRENDRLFFSFPLGSVTKQGQVYDTYSWGDLGYLCVVDREFGPPIISLDCTENNNTPPGHLNMSYEEYAALYPHNVGLGGLSIHNYYRLGPVYNLPLRQGYRTNYRYNGPRPAYAPGYEHLAPRSNLLNINSPNNATKNDPLKHNEGECSICLESTFYKNGDPSKKYSNEERKKMLKKLKKCGHIFHEKCIRQVTDGKCPLCRKEFTI